MKKAYNFMIFLFLLPCLSIGQECAIRILFLASEDAFTEAGNLGTSMMQLAIENIDQCNRVFVNSNLNDTRVQLAGVVSISNNLAREGAPEYPGGDLLSGVNYWLEAGNTLSQLSADAWVNALREDLEADVIALIKHRGSSRARAFQIGPTDPNYGYVVIDIERLDGGEPTFTHELGHIFGCDHDDSNATANNPLAFPAIHGPNSQGFNGGRGVRGSGPDWNTIMAYPACGAGGCSNELEYFSESGRSINIAGHGNTPIGDNAHRNTWVIERNDQDLATFRNFENNETLSNRTIHSGEYIHMSAPGTLTLNNITQEAGSRGEWTGQTVLITNAFFPPGVEINSDPHCNGMAVIPLAVNDNPIHDEFINIESISNVADKNQSAPDLSIYPNPSYDGRFSFHLKDTEMQGNADIFVFNPYGRMIWSRQNVDGKMLTTGGATIDISGFHVESGYPFVVLQVIDKMSKLTLRKIVVLH